MRITTSYENVLYRVRKWIPRIETKSTWILCRSRWKYCFICKCFIFRIQLCAPKNHQTQNLILEYSVISFGARLEFNYPMNVDQLWKRMWIFRADYNMCTCKCLHLMWCQCMVCSDVCVESAALISDLLHTNKFAIWSIPIISFACWTFSGIETVGRLEETKPCGK